MAKSKENTSKKSPKPQGIEAAGKIWVSREYPKNPSKDAQDEKYLHVRSFEVEPAWIRVGYGLTKNLGNYESARCDVGVTLPCYVEEIPEAFEEAWEIAHKEIQAQVEQINSPPRRKR